MCPICHWNCPEAFGCIHSVKIFFRSLSGTRANFMAGAEAREQIIRLIKPVTVKSSCTTYLHEFYIKKVHYLLISAT